MKNSSKYLLIAGGIAPGFAGGMTIRELWKLK
jgi:hypothetical protein